MKKNEKNILVSLVAVVVVVLIGFGVAYFFLLEGVWSCDEGGQWVRKGWPNYPRPTSTCRLSVGLPNPASVNCEQIGGRLDLRTDVDGGQVGYCFLPDGQECEEWALLRGECPLPSEAEFFRNLNIRPGQTISSPLSLTGEARGYWFFEGDFPIVLVNWNGLIIGEGLAQAQSDWMTVDFVPFVAEIRFTKPTNPTNQDYARRGAIIFQKSNPSGLSTHDSAYELPINF